MESAKVLKNFDSYKVEKSYNYNYGLLHTAECPFPCMASVILFIKMVIYLSPDICRKLKGRWNCRNTKSCVHFFSLLGLITCRYDCPIATTTQVTFIFLCIAIRSHSSKILCWLLGVSVADLAKFQFLFSYRRLLIHPSLAGKRRPCLIASCNISPHRYSK